MDKRHYESIVVKTDVFISLYYAISHLIDEKYSLHSTGKIKQLHGCAFCVPLRKALFGFSSGAARLTPAADQMQQPCNRRKASARPVSIVNHMFASARTAHQQFHCDLLGTDAAQRSTTQSNERNSAVRWQLARFNQKCLTSGSTDAVSNTSVSRDCDRHMQMRISSSVHACTRRVSPSSPNCEVLGSLIITHVLFASPRTAPISV